LAPCQQFAEVLIEGQKRTPGLYGDGRDCHVTISGMKFNDRIDVVPNNTKRIDSLLWDILVCEKSHIITL